jgi:hypothetical protein
MKEPGHSCANTVFKERVMSTNNRGGARPGAGRPQIETIKVPKKQDWKWIVVGVPLETWQDFCKSAASSGLVGQDDYGKFADLVMIGALDRYIKSTKRRNKQNEQS